MAKAKVNPAALDGKASFTDGELEQLVEYVFGHRMSPIQGFLEEHGLKRSGVAGVPPVRFDG